MTIAPGASRMVLRAATGVSSEGSPDRSVPGLIGAWVTRAMTGAACLLAVAIAGCSTPPADYAATLSPQDPKWRTQECAQIRAEAANYQDAKTISWAQGALLGPYGLGIAAAGKDNREKRRQLLAREVHLRCSSRPLPPGLLVAPQAGPKTNPS